MNVLKECCIDNCDDGTDYDTKDIPNMNSLKTQLPIAVQDPSTGKVPANTYIVYNYLHIQPNLRTKDTLGPI